MKCRRICRELLWLSRFGDFGPSSQPHLDHLAACGGCRDEVGFDRALVEQLRIALARRIADADPSPTAWERILAQAQAPQPPATARFREWSSAMLARLRTATAMASTGLALVLALNMQIVPAAVPSSDGSAAAFERSPLQQVPRIPLGQSSAASLAQLVEDWNAQGDGSRRPDPEASLRVATRAPVAGSEETSEEPAEEAPSTELRLVFRPMQTPDPGAASASGGVVEAEQGWLPVRSEPGEPS